MRRRKAKGRVWAWPRRLGRGISLGAVTLTASCNPTSPPSEQPQKARPPNATASVAPEIAPEATHTEQATAAKRTAPAPPAPDADPPPQPAKRRYVVAALGDSITDSRVGGGGYLHYLESACPESRFVNFGKGGDMTNQMRKRWQRDILPQQESLELNTLLVFGGVNDLYSDLTAGRSNERIEADLSAIYSSAQAAGLEVIAITVSPWGGFTRYFNPRRGKNTRRLNAWLLGLVAEKQLNHAVDSYPLLSCGQPERLCPAYESRYRDGLHLGPQGHQVLGEKLLATVFSDCR